MKKAFLILCAAALALVSCNKDLAPADNDQGGAKEPIDVVFNLSATHPDGSDTKAVKTAWETGDVVFVFFSGQTAPAYLELKYDGTKWVNTPKKGLSFSEGDTGTMTAVYLPFGSGATVVDDGSGGYKFDKTYYSYFLTSSMTYDVSGEEVSGTFNMQIPDGYVQFFINFEPSYDLIEIREPHLTPQGIASITKDGDVALTNVARGAPLPGYKCKDGSGYIFSGILSDDARNDKGEKHIIDYHFTMVINGWKGYYFSKVCEGKQLYRGEKEGRALRFEGNWVGAITDYKPIDLGCDVTEGGVTKRIYWSSRNIGATADTGEASYGDYYAWGETETYYEAGYARENPQNHWKTDKGNGYAWGSYRKFNPTGDGTTFEKYTGSDYDTLQPDDDAAHVIVGGIWRMPTSKEWEALINTNFTWTWDTDHGGRKVTSNIEGYNSDDGPYIFLPAAGCWDSTRFYDGGSYGYYWSSSLRTVVPNDDAWYGFFLSTNVDVRNIGRYSGLSVRPVTD